MNEVTFSSSGCSDLFVAYYFVTGTVQRYLVELTAPLKLYTVDAGPLVPLMAPALNLNWLPGVSRKKVFKVGYDYRRYCVIIHDDSG